MLTKIDLSLISGARPYLLKRSLDSLNRVLNLPFFQNVVINIDPYRGCMKEQMECKDLLQEFFVNKCVVLEINVAGIACFGRAVARNWGAVVSPWCFHTEDDWVYDPELWNEIIKGIDVVSEDVGQYVLNHSNKNVKSKEFHFSRIPRRFWRVRMGSVELLNSPIFSTSPAMVRRDFARCAASFMNENLDPEKQLNDASNPTLRKVISKYRSRLLSENGQHLVFDIGRDLRGAV